jgi:hypothetical protein
MPTIIHFVGRDQLMVREDEIEVQKAFVEYGGKPMPLTHQRSGSTVFINPAQIAYWQGRGPRAMPDRNRVGVGRIPSLR